MDDPYITHNVEQAQAMAIEKLRESKQFILVCTEAPFDAIDGDQTTIVCCNGLFGLSALRLLAQSLAESAAGDFLQGFGSDEGGGIEET